MANVVDIDLGDLYQKAFGKPTSAFNPQLTPVVGDTALSRTSQSATGSPYYDVAANGVEYFMPVKVSYPDSDTGNGLLPGGTGVLLSWNLPFPIISITGRKVTVKTPLTERRGEVVELINLKGYDITIRGFIISETEDFPEADVVKLRNLYEQNVAINLQSAYTDIFLLRPDRKGTDTVVIEELLLPELRGVKNIRPYELKLVSDEIFNLIDIN